MPYRLVKLQMPVAAYQKIDISFLLMSFDKTFPCAYLLYNDIIIESKNTAKSQSVFFGFSSSSAVLQLYGNRDIRTGF